MASEDGELMPEGENLRFEFKTRPNGGPEGGEQSDEQGQHAGRERYQPSAKICNGDKMFGTSGGNSRYREGCASRETVTNER